MPVSVGLLTKDCGGQRTVIMSSDLCVREQDGLALFL